MAKTPSPTSTEGRHRAAANPLPSRRIEPGPATPDAFPLKDSELFSSRSPESFGSATGMPLETVEPPLSVP